MNILGRAIVLLYAAIPPPKKRAMTRMVKLRTAPAIPTEAVLVQTEKLNVDIMMVGVVSERIGFIDLFDPYQCDSSHTGFPYYPSIIRLLYFGVLRRFNRRNLLFSRHVGARVMCVDLRWWLPMPRRTGEMRWLRRIRRFVCKIWSEVVFRSIRYTLQSTLLCFGSIIDALGYCTSLCCDDATEETCYSTDTYEPDSCALISDGGCPCSEGETKCGAFPGYAGMRSESDYDDDSCLQS